MNWMSKDNFNSSVKYSDTHFQLAESRTKESVQRKFEKNSGERVHLLVKIQAHKYGSILSIEHHLDAANPPLNQHC